MITLKTPLVRFALLVWVLILIPIAIIAIKYQREYSMLEVVLSSFGISILLAMVYYWLEKINKYFALAVTLILFVFSFFIRLILSFVYDFSGKGFTSEFFAHFSWHSFKIGLSDYGFLFFFAIFILLVLLYVFTKLLSQIKFKQKKIPIMLFLIAVFLILIFKNNLPEWHFYTGYNHYYFSQLKTLTPEEAKKQAKQTLKNLRPASSFPIDKKDLIVTTKGKPKNIILIYLESFSEMLSENDRFPGLTPHIDQLKKDNFSFKNNFSSAYVTIEGIANSQCGTLLDMDNGNNSLLTKSGRLSNLPCLGDILRKAGYQQSFYGGADLGFAGKGAFLQEHGYDELKGVNYWKKLSLETNTWGLVDNSLFDYAIKKIRNLSKQSQPYNMTLLTLGTHIPGFTYNGCTPYNQANIQAPYLDAIHCTDLLLGKFIDQLKQEKLLDNTLVYIQGDHSIFPTHELTEIFTDQTTDRRILTIIIDESLKQKKMDEAKLTSTFNLVANVLDLLGINHNVNFTFAQSDFNAVKKVHQDYFVTRYVDYDETKIITNVFAQSDCQVDEEITLPLDTCEKKRVMQSVYQLNASYSIEDSKPMECNEGVKISINPYSNAFVINWGGVDITHQFFSRGRRITNQLPGFYLIELNNNDEIKQLHFFLDRDLETLKRLNKFLAKDTERFLLFSNLTTGQINEINLPNLPDYFHKDKWLYAEIKNGLITSINTEEMSLGAVKFLPVACKGKFEVISYQKPKEIELPNKLGFCSIKAWGPKGTIKGQSFNTQPSGLSAFWLKTDCAPKGAVMRVNGKALKTEVNLPIITAAIDDKLFFPESGNYQIKLYGEISNESHSIGEFEVLPTKRKPID